MFTNFFIYWIPVLFNLLFLIWWACGTEYTREDYKFPALGHIIVLVGTSLIPIWAILQALVLVGIYGCSRANDDIVLKKNKFNKIFFKVKTDE